MYICDVCGLQADVGNVGLGITASRFFVYQATGRDSCYRCSMKGFQVLDLWFRGLAPAHICEA